MLPSEPVPRSEWSVMCCEVELAMPPARANMAFWFCLRPGADRPGSIGSAKRDPDASGSKPFGPLKKIPSVSHDRGRIRQ